MKNTNKNRDVNQDYQTGILPAIEVINFSKKYKRRGKYAVENANFKVFPGTFHGFIGANGAGKTTTIKSLIGAYRKFKGKIKIFGKKNFSLAAKKLIGYIPEDTKFPKNFSAQNFITYMAFLTGMSKKKANKYAKEILEKIGLSNIAKRSPNTFSSGQKKKVLLAQALVGDPKVLIMDEPAANLDPKARIDFFNSLKKLRKEGKAIFISSHILTELDKYIDSVTILDGGKVVYSGLIKDIASTKKNIYSIVVDDFAMVNKFFISEKYKVISKKANKNSFIIDMQDNKQLNNFLKFTAKNNIEIRELQKRNITLDDTYARFVKKGSTETGIGGKND